MIYTVAIGATIKMDFNLLKVFAKVAELGSFTKAATTLKQPKSRVSRAIARLESELDVQLFRRTTRKTSLTNSGLEFYQNIHPLLNSINSELIKLSDQHQDMAGTIRLTASQDIGQTLVTKIISAYNLKYPKVYFEVIITNDFLDLAKANIDIAFRAGKLQDSSLIQKKFISTYFVIVCSENYIERFGRLNSIEDLKNHKFLSFKGLERGFFKKAPKIMPTITSDSLPMLLNLVLNGDGIAAMPSFFCEEHLENKRLVRLVSKWQSKTENLHILYMPSKNISPRVKAFADMATSIFNRST